MGIDPLTHNPLSTATDQSQSQFQPQQQQQNKDSQPHEQTFSEVVLDQNKEITAETTSFQSSYVTEQELTENSPTSTFVVVDDNGMELINNGFCTDEVPLMEPHEIVVASSSLSSATTTTSSSSSSSKSSNFLENLQLIPDFEWPPCEYYGNDNNGGNNAGTMRLWDDDYFNGWDLLINNDDDAYTKQINVDPAPLSQCPKTVLDQEYWAYGLL